MLSFASLPHRSWLEKTLQKNIPCSILWYYHGLAHLIQRAIQSDIKLHVKLLLNIIQISYCFIIFFLHTRSQSVFSKTILFLPLSWICIMSRTSFWDLGWVKLVEFLSCEIQLIGGIMVWLSKIQYWPNSTCLHLIRFWCGIRLKKVPLWSVASEI